MAYNKYEENENTSTLCCLKIIYQLLMWREKVVNCNVRARDIHGPRSVFNTCELCINLNKFRKILCNIKHASSFRLLPFNVHSIKMSECLIKKTTSLRRRKQSRDFL